MANWSIDQKTAEFDVRHNRFASGTLGIDDKQNPPSTGRISMKDGRIIVNDGTTNRILIGYGQGLF
jgi:hypothetical protein